MRTRTWWGKKRPLHYDTFETVEAGDGWHQIICPHGDGAMTNEPGRHYCLSLGDRPLLEPLGLGLVVHMTHPIGYLNTQNLRHYRRAVRVD